MINDDIQDRIMANYRKVVAKAGRPTVDTKPEVHATTREKRNGKNCKVEPHIYATKNGLLRVKVGGKWLTGLNETLPAARIKRDTELVKLAKAKYKKKMDLLLVKQEQAVYDMEMKHILEVGYLEEQIHNNTETNKKVKWRTQP